MSINITKHTSYNKTNYCPNRKIKYIVIHYTAGSTSRAGSAVNTANFWATSSYEGSADFAVDDATIVQYNPDLNNYLCWHCGDGYNGGTGGGSFYGVCTNANSIGIEICSNNDNYSSTDPWNSPKWYFTNSEINNAVELTKYLMQKYGVDVNHVIRHYDVSGKVCPGIIGWNKYNGSNENKWLDFKKRISNTVSITNTSNKTNTTAANKTSSATTDNTNLYRVRKTWSDSKSQIGAYKNLDSAKSIANKNKGYYVFDNKGNIVYPKTTSTNSFKSYTVKITADVLNVRKGAGTSYAIVTTVKQNEVYTIVDEKNGWGLLKAYKSGRNGWISLAYTKKR